MKNDKFLVLTLTLAPVILLGCQVGVNNSTNILEIEQQTIANQAEANQILKSDQVVKKVSISKLQSKNVHVLDDEKSIETLRHALTSAVEEKGIANVGNPEFSAKIVYTDDQTETYYLWLGKKEKKSTFMHSENTHTIYTVSEEHTEELLDLIEKQ